MQARSSEVATRKEKWLFLARLIVFAGLLTLALMYVSYVLTPKYDYGICSMTNLYRQQQNTVDVLVLGTSAAYAGVNTNVLWDEYGIAAYNLCGAEQPYWISYYYLEEALKTQAPELILLDAKPSIYRQDYSKRGRTILGTYGIKDPLTRLKAIRASVADDDFWSFALKFPQIHDNYSDLNIDSFIYPPTNEGRGADWKGYIESEDTAQHFRPSLVWVATRKPLNHRQEEYFRRILELAGARAIPVMLVGFPNPDYANEHMYYNSLWSIASEYGVDGINYNNPDLRFGLRYSSDFADWQHLNVKGSVTFTRKLGGDLKQIYNLPDRRGDARYNSWETCARSWYTKYPEYSLEEMKGEAKQ